MTTPTQAPASHLTLGDKEKLLVVLPHPRHEAWIARVQAKNPGWQIVWFDNRRPGGLVRPDEMDAAIWLGVTVYCSFMPASAELMRRVCFVQLATAGNDKWRENAAFLSPDVVFASASGCQPVQIAEWVMGCWLAHQHAFPYFAERQTRGAWEVAAASSVKIQDSFGLRMGILGYGAIGRQCGRLAKALGMQVLTYTRTPRPDAASRRDGTYCVPGTGDPDGTVPDDWFSGSVDEFLGQDLDILVVCVPLTKETRGMIGQHQFGILGRRKTFLCNVARGPLVQTDALVEALSSGGIRGAALDVTDPEPLPEGHPLWSAPNVFITPHVSWKTEAYWVRVVELLEINLDRIRSGLPPLNLLDKKSS